MAFRRLRARLAPLIVLSAFVVGCGSDAKPSTDGAKPGTPAAGVKVQPKKQPSQAD